MISIIILIIVLIIIVGALVFVFYNNTSEKEPINASENTLSDANNSYSEVTNTSSSKTNNQKENTNKKTTSDIEWKYKDLEDGTISIYQYETNHVPETMKIPSKVDGKTVTEIEALFAHEETVKKVILPSTLKIIGIETFKYSTSIEEVEINSAIELIAGHAFYKCSGIKRLTFPEGLKKIDETGIFLCEGLEELHVPGSVKMTWDQLDHAVILKKDTTTIYAPAGSVWEKLANEIGYKFVAE